MRKIANVRPKTIVYADQVARTRKMLAALTDPPKPVKPMLDDIIANLEMRRGKTRHNDVALVNWLVECGVARFALTFEGAIKEMRTAPYGQLSKVAAVLREY
jgi:hypothetical protein